MNIGIDSKSLGKPRAGIARRLESMLCALSRVDKKNTYVLFDKYGSAQVPTAPNFKRVALPSGLPGTLWLQCVLPRYIRCHAIDILLKTTSQKREQ